MINRLTAAILSIFFICTSSWAEDKTYNITFEKGINEIRQSLSTGNNVIFRLEEHNNRNTVVVSLENTGDSNNLLIFRDNLINKKLKKHKPKIEFAKYYFGDKNNRYVDGCRYLKSTFIAIKPEETSELLKMDIGKSSTNELVLPVYSAKFVKRIFRRNAYQIYEANKLVFNLNIRPWDENDPEYTEVKSAVKDYLYSLDKVTFCDNKKHSPSLEEQQCGYKAKKDSLVEVIRTIINDHNLMSTDVEYEAYTKLLEQLNDANLNDHNHDCGKHKAKPKQHSCSYCSLSEKEIYDNIDALYQEFYAGKILKDEAVKKAKALYNCYQNSAKRKKSSLYKEKIIGFYDLIVK